MLHINEVLKQSASQVIIFKIPELQANSKPRSPCDVSNVLTQDCWIQIIMPLLNHIQSKLNYEDYCEGMEDFVE